MWSAGASVKSMPSGREIVGKALVEAGQARRLERAFHADFKERIGARTLKRAVASPSAMEEAATDMMRGKTEEERRWALRAELVGVVRTIYLDETQAALVRIAAARTLVTWMGGDVLVKREADETKNVLRIETAQLAQEARDTLDTVVVAEVRNGA